MPPFLKAVYTLNNLWPCFTECSGIKLRRVGCYIDKSDPKDRTLPELVLTYRDTTSKVYVGESINWRSFDTYLEKYICNCADKVLKKGFPVMGLQYYGMFGLYSLRLIENTHKTLILLVF